MIKVAICDDDIKFCADIYDLILNYAKREHKRIYVDLFYSGNELLSNIKSGEYYNILFLDIALGDLTYGSDIGNYLRNEMDNQTTSIVYISSYTEYANILFASRPLDFIEKPINESKIYKIFEVYGKIRNSENIAFEVKNESNTTFVLYKDIIYFTRELRKLIVVTKDCRYKCYSKFNELENIDGFIKINQSFLINVNYIKKYNYRSVVLINDDFLSISQPYRSIVKKYLENL